MLNGWKQIAGYLGVSIRTAQNLEKEQGLPVRRGPGIKTPVLVRITELEVWQRNQIVLRNAVAKQNASAPNLPSQPRLTIDPSAEEPFAHNGDDNRQITGAQNVGRRQWLRKALIGGGGVLGMAGIGLLGSANFNNHQPASAYRIQGATLIVSGRDNVELWRYTFPTQMVAGIYGGDPSAWCRFADLDGDGKVETVFVYRPDGAMSSLWCFGADGERRWVFAPGKAITDDLGRTVAPSYGVSNFEVVSSQTLEIAHIVVSSYHHWSFPNQVAVLDSRTGNVLSEHWHRGHLWHMAVADIDGDGEPEVLLGGVNDAPEYKQATLLVFDHRRISGATRNPAGQVYFQGMELGTEKYVVFFPRTPISQTEEFNRVRGVRIASDRIIITVAEGIAEATAPGIIYELDFTLRPTNAMLVGNLAQRYRDLQDSGRLPKEAPGTIAERLMKEVKVIKGLR